MAFALLILCLAALLVSALLLFQIFRMRQRMQSLQARLEAAPATRLGNRKPIIGIEILNPFELAVATNKMAKPMVAIAPELLRRIVYKRTVEKLSPQLEEYGVKASIRVYNQGAADDMD